MGDAQTVKPALIALAVLAAFLWLAPPLPFIMAMVAFIGMVMGSHGGGLRRKRHSASAPSTIPTA